VHNGGYCQADRVLNLRVDGTNTVRPPEVTLQRYADVQGWKGTTVGLMTAAPMDSLSYRSEEYRGESLALWLTCGLDNARRAGDPCDWEGGAVPPAGTINTVFATSLRLSQAGMAELLMLLTEAKCAIFQEAGITSPVSGGIATGTGTDATVIVSGSGRPERWAGKHTLLGERAARLMMDALRASIGPTL
jgi:adenosylcobinamide amidohydrolase